MKKLVVFLIIVLVFSLGGVYGYYIVVNNTGTLPNFINKKPPDGNFIIKKSGKVIEELNNREEAIEKAKELERSVVIDKNNDKWVYSTLSPFLIITDTAVHDFKSFDSAFRYAKKNGYHQIYYNSDKKPIWKDTEKLPSKKKLKVSLIMQMPELPRGCEVTSLAMLFRYNGENVSKIELADKIKKDTTPYKIDKEGHVTYGNPYDGFVGDMYNVQNNGYGVYHGPIAELARTYFKEKVIDLTWLEFEEVLRFVSNGCPVWVVTNSTYKSLDETYFEMWDTPTGLVKVTNKLHAVVITGYDQKNVYINDPLNSTPSRAVDREEFKKAWEQMGNQAVTIIK